MSTIEIDTRPPGEALWHSPAWFGRERMANGAFKLKAFIILRIAHIISYFLHAMPYKRCCKLKPQTSL